MDETGPVGLALLSSLFKPVSPDQWLSITGLVVGMLFCLLLSAICSSSENAFFSHRESDIEDMQGDHSRSSRLILKLLSSPKHLLATMLVMNSFGVVAFVLLSNTLIDMLFDIEHNPLLHFLIDAILITLIVLIFAEVTPKVYATQHYRKSARFLALPMRFFMGLAWPLTQFLVRSTAFFEKRIKSRAPELTPEELSHAIDITTDELDAKQEKEILKGIVNIGQTQVKQIMRSRMDVQALDDSWNFAQVMEFVREMRFSRMPVFQENLDGISGVLNIKDLMPHLEKGDDFRWQKLQRAPMFIPENKMIDDLLHEFREKRNHMAVVVDEYGGCSGIVTLEDILEEVFGEINDEYDDDTLHYSKLDENSYVFEGKMQINDVCRILGLPIGYFDEVNEENDTLGGLLTEISGRIPHSGERIEYKDISFVVEAADMRKIKRVKLKLELKEEGGHA